MIDLQPVIPGYIVHIDDEFDYYDLNEYLKSHGFNGFGNQSDGYTWFRIKYGQCGEVMAWKGDESSYYRSIIDGVKVLHYRFKDYVQIEFSEIRTGFDDSLFTEFMDLMG